MTLKETLTKSFEIRKKVRIASKGNSNSDSQLLEECDKEVYPTTVVPLRATVTSQLLAIHLKKIQKSINRDSIK